MQFFRKQNILSESGSGTFKDSNPSWVTLKSLFFFGLYTFQLHKKAPELHKGFAHMPCW